MSARAFRRVVVANLLVAASLAACGSGGSGGGATATTTQQVPDASGTSAAPGSASGAADAGAPGTNAATGVPAPRPGSSTSVVVLSAAKGFLSVSMVASRNGDVFTLVRGVSDTPYPVLQKRDTSGAIRWSAVITPACIDGWWTLGPSDDGGAAVAVADCPLGHSLPGMSDVSLLRPDGSVASRFTTGIGVAAVSNRFGEVYAFAADPGLPITYGPIPGMFQGSMVRPPAFLRLIGPDGTDRWVWRDDSLSQRVPLALRATADGGVVGITDGGTDGGNAVFRLDRVGTLLWWSALPSALRPYRPDSAAELADGSVAVVGDTNGLVAFGGAQAGAPGRVGRALLVLRNDGAPRTILALPDPLPDQGRSLAATALPGGGVVVWEQQFGCERLWAFGTDLAPRWSRNVDSACAASLQSIAATGDALLVTGWLNATPAGGGDFGNGQRLTPGADPVYFLLSIAP